LPQAHTPAVEKVDSGVDAHFPSLIFPRIVTGKLWKGKRPARSTPTPDLCPPVDRVRLRASADSHSPHVRKLVTA
jgi:hypothetical protein